VDEAHPQLTDQDREQLARTWLEIDRPDEPHWVRQTLTFTFNKAGAVAAYDKLDQLGFHEIVVDEEVEGGGYWYVVAWRLQPLNESAVARARAELEAVAESLDGEYEGWALAGGDVTKPFMWTPPSFGTAGPPHEQLN
jgi:hypothetical protein